MILLVHQIIDTTITYFSFSNVIKIDVKQYYEDLTLPAITFGLNVATAMNYGKYEKIFDKKCLDELKKLKDIPRILIDCVHSNGVTRKTLLKFLTFDEFNRYTKINLDENHLNMTSSSKLIQGFDLRSTNNLNSVDPIKLLTFIFNQKTNQMLNSNKFQHNFLTIFYGLKTFLKLKNLTETKSFDLNKALLICIHSPQSPIFIANNANKQTKEYKSLYNQNTSIMVHKTVKLNLGYPYGVCSHYKSQNTPFKATSQSDCLRKCSKTYFEKILKCSPLLTNGFISELDETETETKFCSKQLNDLYHEIIYNEEMIDKCNKLCPKDCAFIDFDVTKTMINYRIIEEPWETYFSMQLRSFENSTLRLSWDMTSPILYYIETPVMSFIEYLCCCGGLFGLWFASDGKLFNNFISDALKNKLSSLSRRFRHF